MSFLSSPKYCDGEIIDFTSRNIPTYEEFFSTFYGYVKNYTYLRYENIATRQDGESDSSSGGGSESDAGGSSGGGNYNGSEQIGGGGSTGGSENPGGGNTGTGSGSGNNTGSGSNSGGGIGGLLADVYLKDAELFDNRSGILYNPNLLLMSFGIYDRNQCLPANMSYIDNNMGGTRNVSFFNNWILEVQPNFMRDGGIKSEYIPSLVGTYFTTLSSLPSGGLYEAINNGYYIMMDVGTGNYIQGVPQTHTITIVAYDPKTGNFIYMDTNYGKLYEINYDVVKNSSFIYIINGRR
ncbi:MAG: hypothetical protein LIO79_09960 [Rikenellaceae bacterium]|nr:hypothetical protein [Rikenellaceae bacterium]